MAGSACSTGVFPKGLVGQVSVAFHSSLGRGRAAGIMTIFGNEVELLPKITQLGNTGMFGQYAFQITDYQDFPCECSGTCNGYSGCQCLLHYGLTACAECMSIITQQYHITLVYIHMHESLCIHFYFVPKLSSYIRTYVYIFKCPYSKAAHVYLYSN